MKALILNSGMGSRMGSLTYEHPKCMTKIDKQETIISRQLKQISEHGIKEVVITTGYQDSVLVDYCYCLDLPLSYTFVKNPIYDKTNYIYSIYCAREYLDDDILLMHGDLVFEDVVLDSIIETPCSCMVVSSTEPLPEKDFKAKIADGIVKAVGVDIFDDAVSAQPLYKLNHNDWKIWLDKISDFIHEGKEKVYAEAALNALNGAANIHALDIKQYLCAEIDTEADLEKVSAILRQISSRVVYMCFSADILHGGHISIINKAQRLGKLVIGVLSDNAVLSYKRFPIVPMSERKLMMQNIIGVHKVLEQSTLSYRHILETLRPDIVVHGDDWRVGFQKPIRDEVISILDTYGGQLVEYPYSVSEKYKEIEAHARADLSMPDIRRGRLKRILDIKGTLTAMEAHDGLTGLVVEDTMVYQDGEARQYDAIWISSLCDSTAKGKPDIEVVDMTSRFRTIEDIAEVTTKPIIFDGDTGGRAEHFAYTVRSLERLGVSMVIIEDKTGLKKNSLFGTDVHQCQDSIENFCDKIQIGKKAQRTKEFMICARIESLILDQGIDDALGRAFAYVNAGADAIMIHSRKKDPSEVFDFIRLFRSKNNNTPLVIVPTSYNSVLEDEWRRRGVNIIIYANHLMRAQVPAIQKTARMILEKQRSKECDEFLMSFQDIIRLIPTEEE